MPKLLARVGEGPRPAPAPAPALGRAALGPLAGRGGRTGVLARISLSSQRCILALAGRGGRTGVLAAAPHAGRDALAIRRALSGLRLRRPCLAIRCPLSAPCIGPAKRGLGAVL